MPVKEAANIALSIATWGSVGKEGETPRGMFGKQVVFKNGEFHETPCETTIGDAATISKNAAII